MKTLILAVLVLASCGKPINEPVYVPYYVEGEVLLPSYACPDTLIVVDAIGLNKGMAYIEQGFIDGSDGDIDSILHTHCIVK